MPDVTEILRNLPAQPADETVVAADVARGHRAVTRRRQQRIGFTAAAVAAVAALSVGAFTGSQTPAPPSVAGSQATAGLSLVAYTGEQPAGFVVTTVPDGWTVISSNEYEFVVAPPGKEKEAAPSSSQAPVMYDDRIAVFMTGEIGPNEKLFVKTVDINGSEGRLYHFPADEQYGSPELDAVTFPSAKGRITVQVPASTGLSADQILHFTEGVSAAG